MDRLLSIFEAGHTPNRSHGGTLSSSNSSDGVPQTTRDTPPSSQDLQSKMPQVLPKLNITKHGALNATNTSTDPLEVMKDVLDTLWDNEVPGPMLFRLKNEFGKEVGKGRQFRVTAASDDFTSKLISVSELYPGHKLKDPINKLRNCVVKRALWVPERPRVHALSNSHNSSNRASKEITLELKAQLQSAQREINRLCNKSFAKHPNIVRLKGWGLCLDTFEGLTSFNTRVPLLILERARFDLGVFLASLSYSTASYEVLCKICQDIGTGLGALHAGNTTHGDLKPANVLLFMEEGSSTRSPFWIAKLCDFGTAISKPESLVGAETKSNLAYTGSPGWTPPERLKGLRFYDLQLCDLFVYGLVVWRIFNIEDPWKVGRKGPIEEKDMEQYRTKDRAYLSAKSSLESLNKKLNRHTEVNRILRILRSSLQANPAFREHRPWQFFDKHRHPFFRTIDESSTIESRNDRHDMRTIVDDLSSKFDSVQAFLTQQYFPTKSTISKTTRTLGLRLERIFRSLRLKSQRQRIFETIFHQYSKPLHLGWHIEETAVVVHPDSHCIDLSTFCEELVALFSSEDDLVIDIIYAYARLRSRFQLCCWKNASSGEPLLKKMLSWLLRDRYRSTEGVPRESLDIVQPDDFTTLAWICHGEIGHAEVLETTAEQGGRQLLWRLAYDKRAAKILMRTSFLMLMMREGASVGDIVDEQDQKTAFRCFLESADISLTFDQLLAPRICEQLTSIAETLKPLDLRSASARFFLTGQTLDSTARISHEEAKKTYVTTALHEAVKASSASAVRALNSVNFPLHVRDSNNKTPADLAHLYRRREPFVGKANSVLNFFKRSPYRAYPKSPDIQLPEGWQEAEFDNGTSLFFESAVNPQNPSITAKFPRFSLLVERSITLGSNQDHESADQGQTYYLDIVRFMQKRERDFIASLPFRESPFKFSSIELLIYDETKFDDNFYKKEIALTKAAPALQWPGKVKDALQASTAKFHQLQRRNARAFVRHIHFRRSRSLGEHSHLLPYRETEELGDPVKDYITRSSAIYDERSWVRAPAYFFQGTYTILLSSYTNILLIFVPISIAAGPSHWGVDAVLSLSIVAFFSLVHSWEFSIKQLSVRYRASQYHETMFETIARCEPEICITIPALFSGNIPFVLTTIIGSVMCNISLMLGACFLLGGFMYCEQAFNQTAATIQSHLVIIASIFSIIPFLFQRTAPTTNTESQVLVLGQGTAIIALLIFALWLLFAFKSHSRLFDEELDGYEEEREEPVIDPWTAGIWALGILTLMGLCANNLVTSVSTKSQAVQNLIGFTLVPILLRFAKHVEAWRASVTRHMDFALSLTIGFSLTIILFLGPVLVLIGSLSGHSIVLRFADMQTISFGVMAWLTAYFVSDGKANYLKGGALVAIYFVTSLGLYIGS